MAIVPARIDVNGKIVKKDRKLRVSKQNEEQIQWIAEDDGGPWTVEFVPKVSTVRATKEVVAARKSHSPFATKKFKVTKSGNKRSGLPVVDHEAVSYKYAVYDSDGNLTDDPDILVDP